MRATLISPEDRADDVEDRRLPTTPANVRNLRLRGGEGEEYIAGGLACCCGVVVFGMLFCTASLGPNTYGLLQNSLTKKVNPTTYRGGLHFVGPLASFIQFPATVIAVEYSWDHEAPGWVGDPIQTRAGAANSKKDSESESGGQDVRISAAFQYTLDPDHLYNVFKERGSIEAAQANYAIVAKNAIVTTCNDFTPSDFWEDRAGVAAAMEDNVRRALKVSNTSAPGGSTGGYANLVMFQIMQAQFNMSYEQSLIDKQVAEQMSVVARYNKSVQEVWQQIKVINAEYQAQVQNLTAYGDAQSRVIQATAKQDAFAMVQKAKAAGYQKLQQDLGFTADQMTKYFKIKSLQLSGQANSKMVVGMPNPVEAAAPPKREL